MKTAIIIIISMGCLIPMVTMYIRSFTPEVKKAEDEYMLLPFKINVIIRTIGLICFMIIVVWLSKSESKGCKECEEYEAINTTVYIKK